MVELSEPEREKVKKNIDVIKDIFESNAKVLAVNSNRQLPDSGGAGSQGAKRNQQSDKNAAKPVNKNFRTRHCVKYHSDAGCGRGDACHFIHDVQYKGRPAPNMDKTVANFANKQLGKPSMGAQMMNPKYAADHAFDPASGFHQSAYPIMGMGALHNSHSDHLGSHPGFIKSGNNFSVTNFRPENKPLGMPPGATVPSGYLNNQPYARVAPPPPGSQHARK